MRIAVDTITTHVWIPDHPRLSPRIPKNPYIFTSSKFLKINYLSAKTDIQVPSLGYRFSFGGGERDRTDDLMLAKHALSQLSYDPLLVVAGDTPTARRPPAKGGPGTQIESTRAGNSVVGLGRLELPTSRLSSARSNQLSYRPNPCRAKRSMPRPKSRHGATGAPMTLF